MTETTLDLRDYVAILWRRKFVITAVALAVFGVAMFYASRQTPVYSSSAAVLVRPVTLYLPTSAPEPLIMQNEQRIATSVRVARVAEQGIQTGTPASISVGIPAGQEVLEFVSESSDPRAAQATAQAYADAYLAYRRETFVAQVESVLAQIEEREADLEDQVLTASQRLLEADSEALVGVLNLRLSSLNAQLMNVRQELATVPASQTLNVGSVLEPAGLSRTPVSPDYRKIGAFGIFLGLSLGVGMAFLQERLRQPLRHRDDVEEAVGAPLVAMVPAWRRGEIVIVEDPQSAPAGAYRALRTRIQYTMARDGIRTFAVTSAHANDGKTTTAMNLAAALAEIDKRVILVLADTRKPAPRRFAARLNGQGLTTVLQGRSDIESALVDVGIPNLSLLLDPKPLPGSSDLLGTNSMKRLLESLGQRADVVIVDTPPVLGPADALEVAQFVDSVLLVADGSRGTRPEVQEAAIELRSVGADIMGVVLTRVSSKSFSPYQHRKDYYRVEQYRQPPVPAEARVMPIEGREERRRDEDPPREARSKSRRG
jgi:capsular exopolysaccharide synthesis family protein